MNARILIEVRSGIIDAVHSNVPVEISIVDWDLTDIGDPVKRSVETLSGCTDAVFAGLLADTDAEIAEVNEQIGGANG